MRALSSREKAIFVICVSTIFIFIGYNGIVKPLRAKAEQVADRIKVNEQKLKKQLKTISQQAIVDREYDQYTSHFQQMGSEQQVMSSILVEIDTAARENQLRIADIKPKRVKKVDFFNNFSVSLSMEGQLTDIVKFLYLLQNSPHLYNVDELMIEKNSPRSTVLNCRLVLSRVLIPQ